MFKPRFAPLVESGVKRQTIRPFPSKHMPKAGDLESWREWTGLPYRSKQRELARVELTFVFPITIERGGISVEGDEKNLRRLAGAIPVADGFASLEEMLKWFEAEHGLPFGGILIEAKDYDPAR